MSCRRLGMLTRGSPPDPKCYFIIPYTFTFIILSHLYHKCHSHCVITTNDGRWAGWGWGCLIYIRLWVGDNGWLLSYSFFLVGGGCCAFVFCCLTFSVPLFRWLGRDSCCVSFIVFSLFSLSLVPLTRSY